MLRLTMWHSDKTVKGVSNLCTERPQERWQMSILNAKMSTVQKWLMLIQANCFSTKRKTDNKGGGATHLNLTAKINTQEKIKSEKRTNSFSRVTRPKWQATLYSSSKYGISQKTLWLGSQKATNFNKRGIKMINYAKIISANDMKLHREEAQAERIAIYRSNCIRTINKALFEKGKTNYIFYHDKSQAGNITDTELKAIAEELKKEYQDKGYDTFLDFYAESNKEKVCCLIVWMP